MDKYLQFNSNYPLEQKRRLVKTLIHRVYKIVSNERDTVEEKSQMKQALNMNSYPDWLIDSIQTIQPSLESMTSVVSDNTSDDGQETERVTTTKKTHQ